MKKNKSQEEITEGTKLDVNKLQHLDGLSEESLSKDLSMDEVWRSKDAMGPISRVHTERLWSNHVSSLR